MSAVIGFFTVSAEERAEESAEAAFSSSPISLIKVVSLVHVQLFTQQRRFRLGFVEQPLLTPDTSVTKSARGPYMFGTIHQKAAKLF
jgi:hypothetical protein